MYEHEIVVPWPPARRPTDSSAVERGCLWISRWTRRATSGSGNNWQDCQAGIEWAEEARSTLAAGQGLVVFYGMAGMVGLPRLAQSIFAFRALGASCPDLPHLES